MSFQTPITVKEAVENIRSKKYLLPSIQRELVWNTHQIEKLFDSLMRDYPVGSFLFWHVDKSRIGDFTFYEFIRNFHERDSKHNKKAEFLVVGARIMLELRGIKCLPLEQVSTKKHSIACTRSFGQTVCEYNQVKEAVLYFLTRVAEKMRKHNLAAHAVTVLVSTDRFHPVPAEYINQATYSSTYPTDSNQEMQEWAIKTLEKIFKDGYDYRKAGVILSGLVPAEKTTQRLFDDEQFKRQHNLMKAVDENNQKFSKDTVRFASLLRGDKAAWRMKQIYKSPSYTTNWNELLTVG